MHFQPKATRTGGGGWGWGGGLTPTSTVNALVVAVLAVSSTVAQLVEMNAFLGADALHVVEGTPDHHLLCTCK